MNRLFPAIFVFLIGCTTVPVTPTVTLPPPQVNVISPTETLIPTETFTVMPTATALPHLMYPYTIAGLREREFAGGEITLDVILGLNDVYTRYLISYPSDGLRITGIMQIPAGEGPFPVIIMNHGYSNRGEYSSGDGTDRAAEYFPSMRSGSCFVSCRDDLTSSTIHPWSPRTIKSARVVQSSHMKAASNRDSTRSSVSNSDVRATASLGIRSSTSTPSGCRSCACVPINCPCSSRNLSASEAGSVELLW